jgi:CheY-like chemotaxis protein
MPKQYANLKSWLSPHRNPAGASLEISDEAVAELSGGKEYEYKRMVEELRTECDELRRHLRNIPEGAQNSATKAADLEKAILAIRQARDSALAQVLDVTRQLRESSAEAEHLRLELDAVQQEKDKLRAEVTTLQKAADGFRGAMQEKEAAYKTAVAKLGAKVSEKQATTDLRLLIAELDAVKSHAETLSTDLRRAQREQQEASAALLEQSYKAERERATATHALEEKQNAIANLTAELERTRMELAGARSAAAYRTVAREWAEDTQAGAELENQREQIAELTRQLNTARDELRMAWSLQRQVLAAPEAAGSGGEPGQETAGSAAALDGAGECVTLSAIAEKLREAEVSADAGLIASAKTQLSDYAKGALSAGSLAGYQLANVCVEALNSAENATEKLALIGPHVTEALQVLGDLAECATCGIQADVSEATVYLLDDDEDNCECIALALEKYGIRTHYATNSSIAMVQLMAEPCDLILLDVDLGGVTGFEIHARLRQIPHHEHTPTLFVSGLSSAEAQVKRLGTETDAFLAKPYTLSVLGLKALQMIAQSRISQSALDERRVARECVAAPVYGEPAGHTHANACKGLTQGPNPE